MVNLDNSSGSVHSSSGFVPDTADSSSGSVPDIEDNGDLHTDPHVLVCTDRYPLDTLWEAYIASHTLNCAWVYGMDCCPLGTLSGADPAVSEDLMGSGVQGES